MWVKVDDGFPEHDKVLEAARHLGGNGAARVITIWLVGMCYCNRNLTDGVVRDAIVRTWTFYDRRPLDVANVMAMEMPNKRPGLLVRVEGGFKFHDYEHYQPSADEVKEKRAKDRERKRKGKPARLPNGIHADSARNPQDETADSSVPGPDPGLSIDTHVQGHRASRRVTQQPEENLRVLKAVIWSEVQAGLNEGETDRSDLLERVKVAAARAHIDYASDQSRNYLHDQFDIAITRLRPQVPTRPARMTA